MFRLINTAKNFDNTKTYYILDFTDLSVSELKKSDLVFLFKTNPEIDIDGVSYRIDEDRDIISAKSYPYGGSDYEPIGDNFLLTYHKLERYGSSYSYKIYKKGISKPIFKSNTPKSNMNYLTFNTQNFDDKYLAIDISGVDKHYYREDREEYFGITVILDVTSDNIKVLRKDENWDIEGDRNYYNYQDGKMLANI